MLFPFSLDKLYLQTDQEGQVKCRLLRLPGVPCQNMVNGETQPQLWPGPPSLLTLSCFQQYKGPICVVKSVYIPPNSHLRSH